MADEIKPENIKPGPASAENNETDELNESELDAVSGGELIKAQLMSSMLADTLKNMQAAQGDALKNNLKG